MAWPGPLLERGHVVNSSYFGNKLVDGEVFFFILVPLLFFFKVLDI